MAETGYFAGVRELPGGEIQNEPTRSEFLCLGGNLAPRHKLGGCAPRDALGRHPPPDPEPQTGPKGISTGPVTAVGFASINVEIRTELEKRVLYAL